MNKLLLTICFFKVSLWAQAHAFNRKTLQQAGIP